MRVEVAWDEAKNNANRKKHGISFEEAGVLFTSGVDYLEIFDEFHSHMEDRFLAIGPITRGLILVVYTEVFETQFGSSAPGRLQNEKGRCTKNI